MSSYNPNPNPTPDPNHPYAQGYPSPRKSNSMVGQVPIIAILMMIQAGLQGLMGLFFTAMGPFIFTILQQAQQNQPGAQAPPKEMVNIMSGYYIVVGLATLMAGILLLVAGIRNLKYRGKVLGIVAMASSLVSIFSCYCAPTAIGLLIYGMIVYLNADVSRAFAMGDQGMSPEQIKASF